VRRQVEGQRWWQGPNSMAGQWRGNEALAIAPWDTYGDQYGQQQTPDKTAARINPMQTPNTVSAPTGTPAGLDLSGLPQALQGYKGLYDANMAELDKLSGQGRQDIMNTYRNLGSQISQDAYSPRRARHVCHADDADGCALEQAAALNRWADQQAANRMATMQGLGGKFLGNLEQQMGQITDYDTAMLGDIGNMMNQGWQQMTGYGIDRGTGTGEHLARSAVQGPGYRTSVTCGRAWNNMRSSAQRPTRRARQTGRASWAVECRRAVRFSARCYKVSVCL